jgi:hypothetical protein
MMAYKVRPIEPPPPPPPPPKWSAKRITRIAGTLLLAWWGWARYHDWQNANNSFLHNLILPIHETGHIVFMAFGEYMHAAGGSLFQILFPAIFVGYFLWKKEKYAATIPLWFAGVSAIDVVSYIKDAPYGEMELIGGEHDWSYLLGETRWMHAANQIGDAVLHFGGLCIVAAVLLGLYWSREEAA